MQTKRIVALMMILVLISGTFTSFGAARVTSGVTEGLYTVPAPSQGSISEADERVTIIKKSGQYIGYRTNEDVALAGDQSKLVAPGGTYVEKMVFNSLSSTWSITASYTLAAGTYQDITEGEYLVTRDDIYDSTQAEILNKNLEPGGEYIPKSSSSESNALQTMEALLVTEIGIQPGNSDSKITSDLDLPTSYEYDGISVDLQWATDSPAVITSDGIVTRPSLGSGDAEVVITATPVISSTSYTDYSKDFTLTVRESNTSDDTNKANAIASVILSELFTFQSGDAADNVTQNVTLTPNIDGFPVTYTVTQGNANAVVNSNTLEITRPVFNAGHSKVAIEVDIGTGDIRTFYLLVKREEISEQITDEELLLGDLDIPYPYNTISTTSVGVADPDTTFSWNLGTLGTDGFVAMTSTGLQILKQPEFGDNPEVGTITATKGSKSRDFQIQVMPKTTLSNADMLDDSVFQFTSGGPSTIYEGFTGVDTFYYKGKDFGLTYAITDNGGGILSETSEGVFSLDSIPTVDTDITIEVTIDGQTKSFTMTVAGRTFTSQNEKDIQDLTFTDAFGVADGKGISSDLTLDGTYVYDASNHSNINNSGVITRPAYGESEATGYVTVSKGAFSKDFYLSVLPQGYVPGSVSDTEVINLVNEGHLNVPSGSIESSGIIQNILLSTGTTFILNDKVLLDSQEETITWSIASGSGTVISLAGNTVTIEGTGNAVLRATKGSATKDFTLKFTTEALRNGLDTDQIFEALDYGDILESGTPLTEATAKNIEANLDFSNINGSFTINSTNSAIANDGTVTRPTYGQGNSAGFVEVTYNGITKKFYTEVTSEAYVSNNVAIINLVHEGFIETTEGYISAPNTVKGVVNNFTLKDTVLYKGTNETITWTIPNDGGGTATLEANGTDVTVNTSGTVTLRASYGGQTKDFTVELVSTTLDTQISNLDGINSLTYSDLHSGGLDQASAKNITSNLDLAGVGTYTVTSSNPAIANNGTVTQPTFEKGKATGFITVEDTHGNTKDFYTEVPASAYALPTADPELQNFKDELNIGYLQLADGTYVSSTEATDVSLEFTPLDTVYYKGSPEPVSYVSSDAAILKEQGSKIVPQADGSATVTMTLDNDNSITKDFTITVNLTTPGAITVGDDLDLANKLAVVSYSDFGAFDETTSKELATDLDLSSFGDFTVTSSDGTSIDNTTGTITRNSYGQSNKPTTIGLEYTDATNSELQQKIFAFNVLSEDYVEVDQDVVNNLNLAHLGLTEGEQTSPTEVKNVTTDFTLDNTVFYRGKELTVNWTLSSGTSATLVGNDVSITDNGTIELTADYNTGSKTFTVHTLKGGLGTDLFNLHDFEMLDYATILEGGGNLNYADRLDIEGALDLSGLGAYTLTNAALTGGRPAYGEGDEVGFVQVEDSTGTYTKEFILGVSQQPYALLGADAINQVNLGHLLVNEGSRDDATTISGVENDFNLKTQVLYNGTWETITWTTGTDNLSGNTVTVDAEEAIDLTATVGGSSETFTVNATPNTLSTDLQEAYDLLNTIDYTNFEAGLNATTAQQVIGNLSFSGLGAYNVTSSNTSIISNGGVVTRPTHLDGDEVVTLTATHASTGTTKEFMFTVLEEPVDTSILANQVPVDYLRDLGNGSVAGETGQVASNLTYGYEDYTITWSINDISVINFNPSPSYEVLKVGNGTFTATVSGDTKTFSLNMNTGLSSERNAEQVATADTLSTYQGAVSVTGNIVTTDITDNGYTVDSFTGNITDTNGTINRPALEDGDYRIGELTVSQDGAQRVLTYKIENDITDINTVPTIDHYLVDGFTDELTLTATLNLPATVRHYGEDLPITWSSGAPAVISDGGVYSEPTYDTELLLTATVQGTDYDLQFVAKGGSESQYTSANFYTVSDKDGQTAEVLSNTYYEFIDFTEGDTKSSISGIFRIPKAIPGSNQTLDAEPILVETGTANTITATIEDDGSYYKIIPQLTSSTQDIDIDLVVDGTDYKLTNLTLDSESSFGSKHTSQIVAPMMFMEEVNGVEEKVVYLNVPESANAPQVDFTEIAYNLEGNPIARNISPNFEFGLKWMNESPEAGNPSNYNSNYLGVEAGGVFLASKLDNNGFNLTPVGLFEFTKSRFDNFNSDVFIYNLKSGENVITDTWAITADYQTESTYDANLTQSVYDDRVLLRLNVEVVKEFEDDEVVYNGSLVPKDLWLGKYPQITLPNDTDFLNHILLNYGSASYLISSDEKFTYNDNFVDVNGKKEYYLDISETASFSVYGVNETTEAWEKLDGFTEVKQGKLNLGSVGLKAIEFMDYNITDDSGTVQLSPASLSKVKLPTLPTNEGSMYVLSRGAFDYFVITAPAPLDDSGAAISYSTDTKFYQLLGGQWKAVDPSLAKSDINGYKVTDFNLFKNSLIYTDTDFDGMAPNTATDFEVGIPRDNIHVPNYNVSVSGRGYMILYNTLTNKVYSMEFDRSFQPFIKDAEIRFPVGATMSNIDVFELDGEAWTQSTELKSNLAVDTEYIGGDQIYFAYGGATTGLLYSSENITHVTGDIVSEKEVQNNLQFYVVDTALDEAPPIPPVVGDAQIVVQETGKIRAYNVKADGGGGIFEANVSDPSIIEAKTGLEMEVYDFSEASGNWVRNNELSGLVDNIYGLPYTEIVNLTSSDLLYTDKDITTGATATPEYPEDSTFDLSALISEFNDPLLAQNRYPSLSEYMIDLTASPLYYLNMYSDVVAATDNGGFYSIQSPKDGLSTHMLVPYYGEYKAFLKTSADLFDVISTVDTSDIEGSDVVKNFEFTTSLLSPDITNPEFNFGYILDKSLYISGEDIVPAVNGDGDMENDEFVSMVREYGVKITFNNEVTLGEATTVKDIDGNLVTIDQGDAITAGTTYYFKSYGIPLDTQQNRYELEMAIEDNTGNTSVVKSITLEQGTGNLILFGGENLSDALKDDILLDNKTPDKTPPRIDLVYQLDNDIYVIGEDGTPLDLSEETSGLATYAYGFTWENGGEVYPFTLSGRDANGNQVLVESDNPIPNGFELFRVSNSQVVGKNGLDIVTTGLNFKLRDAAGNLTETGALTVETSTKYSVLYRRDGYTMPEYVENLLDRAPDIDVSNDTTAPVITQIKAENGYLITSGYDDKLLHDNAYGFEFYDSTILTEDVNTVGIDGTPRIYPAGTLIPDTTDFYNEENSQKVTYPAHVLVTLRDANGNLAAREVTVDSDGIVYQKDGYNPPDEGDDIPDDGEATNTAPVIADVVSNYGFVVIEGFDPENNLDMHPYGFEILSPFETIVPFYGVDVNGSVIEFAKGDLVPSGTLVYKEENKQYFPSGTKLRVHLRDIYGLFTTYDTQIEIEQEAGGQDPDDIPIPEETDDNLAPVLTSHTVVGDQISIKGFDPEGNLHNYPYGYEFLEPVVLKTDFNGVDRVGNLVNYSAGDIIPANKVIFTQNSVQEVMPGSILRIYLRDALGVETSKQVTITLESFLDTDEAEDKISVMPSNDIILNIPTEVEGFDWNTHDYVVQVEDANGEIIYEIEKDIAEVVIIPQIQGDGLRINQQVLKTLDDNKLVDISSPLPVIDVEPPKIINVTYQGSLLTVEAADDVGLADAAYNIHIKNGTLSDLGFTAKNTKRVLPGDEVLIQVRDKAGNKISKLFTVSSSGQIPDITKEPKIIELEKYRYYPENVLKMLLASKAGLVSSKVKLLPSEAISKKGNLVSIKRDNAVVQLQDILTGEIFEVKPDLKHNGSISRTKLIETGSKFDVTKLMKSGIEDEFGTVNNMVWEYKSGPAYVSDGKLYSNGSGIVELEMQDSTGKKSNFYIASKDDISKKDVINDLDNQPIPHTLRYTPGELLDLDKYMTKDFLILEPVSNIKEVGYKYQVIDTQEDKIRFSVIDVINGVEQEYIIQLVTENSKEFKNTNLLSDIERKQLMQIQNILVMDSDEKFYSGNSVTKRQLMSALNRVKVFYGDNDINHRDFYRVDIEPSDYDYFNFLNLFNEVEEAKIAEILGEKEGLDSFITRADLARILNNTIFSQVGHHASSSSYQDIDGDLSQLVGKLQLMEVIDFSGRQYEPNSLLTANELISVLVNIKEYYR